MSGGKGMRRVDRVLVIKGQSNYGQIRYAIDEMIEGFLGKGCLVTILDLIRDEGERLRLREEYLSDYDLIFSMNLVGIELYQNYKFKEDAVFWGYLEDHPFHHHSRLSRAGKGVFISCCDRKQVEYVDRYYSKIPWVSFMPHGGSVGDIHSKTFSARDNAIVFFGSLGNEEDIHRRLDLTRSKYGKGIDKAVEEILENPGLAMEEVLSDPAYGIGVDERFAEKMSELSVIDELRRFEKRKRLMEALADAGRCVTIYGKGWEGLSEKARKVHRLMGSIEHSGIGMVMGASRYVLNDMPAFPDGSHDRVFAAMQCGAVCLTDRSVFLEETFQNMEEIVFYDTDHPEKLADIINRLNEDEDRAAYIAANGQTAARDYTWRNVAKDIIEIVESLE